GAGQGRAAASRADQISDPDVAQPVRRRYRQPAPRCHFRLGHRQHGAEPADGRPAAAGGAPQPGSVYGGIAFDVPRAADSGRHVSLRYPAGDAGSANPAFGRGDEMTDNSGPTRDQSTLEHWYSKEPFDPYSVEQFTAEQERFYMASQWQMMWWKFRRHRVAMISGLVLLLFYLSILISEFLAPYNLHTRHTKYIFAPPQSIHLFHEGEFVGPFVYGYKQTLNRETLKREYEINTSKPYPLRFFCEGDEYEFWGKIKGNLHLVCPDDKSLATFFWLGTDRLGRDILSRIIYGARISLSIGLIGIAISFTLGIVLGGISGYYGGWIDNVIQRTIEL